MPSNIKIELPEPLHRMGYTRKQVAEICRKYKIRHRQFNKAFGVQTTAYDEKLGVILYPCDVEQTLRQILTKTKPHHLAWD